MKHFSKKRFFILAGCLYGLTHAATAGVLNGSNAVTNPSTNLSVNLTVEGTADWAHWGLGGTVPSMNRKNVVQQISDVTPIVPATISANTEPAAPYFSWTDGTPAATATSTQDQYYVCNVGDGFIFTAPADTAMRRLKFYGGFYGGTPSATTGTLTASLSDASAPNYVHVAASDTNAQEYVYTLDYQANGPGQTLTVRWELTSGVCPLFFHAAALQVLALPTATPTLTPTPAPPVLSGSIVSTVDPASSVSVNLTTEGPADWAHWGHSAPIATPPPTLFEHKNGANLISDLTLIGSSHTINDDNQTTHFNWTDGTVNPVIADTYGGHYTCVSAGSGYRFTVPADQGLRTLKVWVSLLDAATMATLSATISDGSSVPIAIPVPAPPSFSFTSYQVNIDFRAASPGQTLTVDFVDSASSCPMFLHAAALVASGPPPTAGPTTTWTFSVTPTPTITRTATPTATPTNTPVTASFPFYDNFDTGVLSGVWTTNSTGNGQAGLTTSYSPQTGSWQMLMETTSGAALNEVVLTINLTGQPNVWLDFKAAGLNEEANGMPGSFSGSTNADGVAISEDGVNWTALASLVPPNQVHGNYLFNLIPAMSGFSSRSHVRIKFQQYDNQTAPDDGIVFDTVSVSALASTATPSTTPTASPSATASPSRTATPSATPTVTQTFSATPSASPSFTHSPTSTATPTATPTGTPTVTLTITPTFTNTPVIASFPFFDGFEGGSLANHWTSASTVAGRIRVIGSGVPLDPLAGSFAAVMDSGVDGNFSRNEMILHIDLSSPSTIFLDFHAKSRNDDFNGLPLNFSGSADGDGVAISEDGVSWTTLLSLSGAVNAWTHYSIDISSAVAGMSSKNHVYLKFQQYDDNSTAFGGDPDGWSFDNIEVKASASTPTPTLTATQTVSPTPTITPSVTATPKPLGAANTLVAYPQPAADTLCLAVNSGGGELVVDLFNVSMRRVGIIRQVVPPGPDYRFCEDIRGLAPGLYFMRPRLEGAKMPLSRFQVAR